MPNTQKKRPYHKILGQVEYMEGDTKVIVTEYANGAKSHKKIRPKRPFYKHVWFYAIIVLVIYGLLAMVRYWPDAAAMIQ